jgi:hypothetical protein
VPTVSLEKIISGTRGDTWTIDARVCKSTYHVFFLEHLVERVKYAVKVFPHDELSIKAFKLELAKHALIKSSYSMVVRALESAEKGPKINIDGLPESVR